MATRQILRLGAFQIEFARLPAHAAVSETVELATARSKGFVNAVLRKVATTPMIWASDAVRLSYPDWIIERLSLEMDPAEAIAALVTMNMPAPVSVREDGYVQDLASQDVVRAVGAVAGEVVVDVCAGPGGKATGLAATKARVVALDISPVRAHLVHTNAVSTGHPLSVLVADARRVPIRPGSAHRVLVDAPCSGLGVLRRRADARWRIQASDIPQLAGLQKSILEEAAGLVRPGGVLLYSVCTLTAQESIDHGIPLGFEPIPRAGDGDVPPLGSHWEEFGFGARVLPHRVDSDGMVLMRYRRTA
jgi:16S rRNA (cytosine967-C5)-methyltransferase